MQSSRIRREVSKSDKLVPGDQVWMGNWHMTCSQHTDEVRVDLWHYETLMATWAFDEAGKCMVKHLSIGIASVTDQQIMNAVLEELRIPLYFSRRGSAARYVSDPMDMPIYMRNDPRFQKCSVK